MFHRELEKKKIKLNTKLLGERDKILVGYLSSTREASLVAQRLKHLPAIWETQVWSLGWEDPLEKEMATHSSIVAWRFMDGGAWKATVHGVAKSRTQLGNFTFFLFFFL